MNETLIDKKTVLKCECTECGWNAMSTWQPQGLRVCNLGVAAYRVSGIPDRCPNREEVQRLLDRLVYQPDDSEPYPEQPAPPADASLAKLLRPG